MKKLISLILLIIWLFVIFYFSNQSGSISGNESGNLLYSILDNIYDIFNIDSSNIESVIEIIHHPLRELMHLLEYLILGIIVYINIKQYNINGNLIIISILLCFIYAITDEIHQIFVPGRTFQYIDLFLDTLGVIIGTFLINKLSFNNKLENKF